MTPALAIARALFGEPHADLSTEEDLWFREDQMIQVDAKTGAWTDHAANKQGADAIDLVRWARKLSREDAKAWVHEQNLAAAGAADAPKATNGHAAPAEQPPWFPDAFQRERDLIGLMLADPDLVAAVEEDITAADFGHPLDATAFVAICEARSKGLEAWQAVQGACAADPAYAAALIANAPMVADAGERAALARDLAKSIAEEVRLLDGGEEVPEAPGPYRFKFGVLRWHEQARTDLPSYRWLVKGVVPSGAAVLIIGRSGSGKSFGTFDLGMHVARGIDYRGRRVARAGVVLCCYEGGQGLSLRMRAYAKANNVSLDSLPFAGLTRPPNLFAVEENIDALADEIGQLADEWKRQHGVGLGAVVLDTHNAATRGSSEIKSDDVSLILGRYDKLRQKTGAGLWIIGHTNTEGRHRGSELIANGIETTLRVELVEQKGVGVLRDDDHRPRHRIYVEKQREGQDGIEWEFVLPQITIGIDEDGDPQTSCVAQLPNRHVEEERRDQQPRKAMQVPPGSFHLKQHEVMLFRALLKALSDGGHAPPPSLGLPASIPRVVTYAELSAAYKSLVPSDEGADAGAEKRYRNTIKSQLRRARDQMLNYRVIGIERVGAEEGGYHVVWPTGRAVFGQGLQWPSAGRAAAMKDEAPLPTDEATGEPLDPKF